MKYSLLFLLVPLMWPSDSEKNPARDERAFAAVVRNAEVVAPETPASTATPAAFLPAATAEDEPIAHVFYHPLIAYPELAFDGDKHQEQMDAWFVTTSEFLESLLAFYKKGYVLVDIGEVYKADEKGRPVKRRLPLPPGKKPLVLSVDDLNYYEYMKKNGTVHRLLLDPSGHLAEFTDLPGREKELSYDRSIPTLLESFVRLHPDFSFQGARGTIALTGYNGVFGYKTNLTKDPAYPQERTEALKVATKLKELGWTFSSHTYFHRDLGRIPLEDLKRDTERWKTEVGAIVGETNVLIYPFGSRMAETSPTFAYLRGQGYSIFLGASNAPCEKFGADYLIAYRLPLDGNALRGRYGNLSRFAALDDLLDPTRKLSMVRPNQPPPPH